MDNKTMARVTLDALCLQRDMLERMADEALRSAIAAQTWGNDTAAAEYLGLRRDIRLSLAEKRQEIARIAEVC